MWLLLLACQKPAEDSAALPDEDGDGHSPYAVYGDDCDDDDPGVYTGADETCDGRDQDCDLRVDEEPVDAPTVWPDTDGDGFGDGEPDVRGCEVEEGWAAAEGDCYDNAILGASVYPGAEEVGFNGRDDDCDPNTPDTCGDSAPALVIFTLRPVEEHNFGGVLSPAVEVYTEFTDADGDLGEGAALALWWGRDDAGGPDIAGEPEAVIGGGDPSAGCSNSTARSTVYVQVGPYLDPDTAYTFAAQLTDKSGAASALESEAVTTP